jgi:L-aminopeptidase/D-esterase-like protein
MTVDIGIDGVFIGHHTDVVACTGCTIILSPGGAVASVDVRGGAPGTRETDLLSPLSSPPLVHGILLTGGSAFGLAAADGVVQYLEENGYGFDTGYARVPLVPAAVVYDLALGRPDVRPRPEHGYTAAAAAAREVEEGSVGAGTGATVGKVRRERSWMKAGLGIAKVELPGGATVVGVSVVNAFGDVLGSDGNVLAGALADDGSFLDTRRHLLTLDDHPHFDRMQNTTLCCVVTDAVLTKTQAASVARMAHDGMARAVSPVHTPVDGDVIFVLSCGSKRSNVFQMGSAAARVVAQSIRRGVRQATGVGGVRALCDLESAKAQSAMDEPSGTCT